MKNVILLIFIGLFSISYGQQKEFKVTGYISDLSTGEPIENVNISIKNSKAGSISNPMGKFSLTFSKLPLILDFTHIGYKTQVIRYDHSPLSDIHIKLIQKPQELFGVTITSQKIDTIFTDKEYSVLDYELLDKGILLLIYRHKLSQSELLVRDYAGTNLATLEVLPMKPLTLYKDCLNNIHIFSKSKSWEILFADNTLKLLKSYDLKYFKETMAGCQFKLGDKVYFEDNEFYDLIKKYYYVDAKDNSAHLLTSVSDEDKLNFLHDNPENMMIGDINAGMENLKGLPDDLMTLGNIRNLTVELRFNKMAYMSKIYAPIYAMNDSISIFNHPNDRIEFYNSSDSLLGTTEIDYHLRQEDESSPEIVYAFAKSTKWLQEIYVDEVKNRAYTLYVNINGTKDLKEINLNTGEVKYILNIPFPYVQKIKVRDSYIYFLYKGFGESQKKKLFRQRIN